MNDRVPYTCDRPCTPQQMEGYFSFDCSAQPLVSLLCKGWPSWLFILNTFYITYPYIFLAHYQVDWITEFQRISPSATFLPYSDFTHSAQICTPMCLVQGSEAWVLQVISSLPAATQVMCALHHHSRIMERPLIPHWEYTTLSHLQCGGVIEGSWTFLFNNCTMQHESVSSYPYNRRLRHIIETTCPPSHWQACDPPLDDSQEFHSAQFIDTSQSILDWNGPLPLHWPLTKIRCKCNFLPTKWAIWSLSVIEPWHAFDVPSNMAALLQHTALDHQESLPFLFSAPVKVLMQVVSAVFGIRGGEGLRS